jgi:hypothetical protein
MNDEPDSNATARFAGFQFGLFHLFAVTTIAAITLSVLRVVQFPPVFLAIVGGYLTLYTLLRGPFLLVKLSRLWQRRQQLIRERQGLERQLHESLRARAERREDATPVTTESSDGVSKTQSPKHEITSSRRKEEID